VSGTGGIRFGQYVLLRRIARGGMAEVFLAQQRGLEGFDRRVAVKRILPHLSDSPDFLKMFLGEAKLAAQLTHPNIVHIYDFGKVEGDYFIAMEYVDGVHTGQLFKHDEKLPMTLVARIGADAAAALHYAHELRGSSGKPLDLVHRDVSPANIMVSFDGAVKLCDFGIAKAAALTDQKTNPGQVKGKYAYMSPEQTIASPLDGRSDVFSLSIVLWELLVGRTIVSRGDVVDAMRAIRDGRLPAIERAAPSVPDPLAKAITWGLATKRENRASAADLAQALEAFIKSSPDIATPMQLGAWIRTRFPREGTSELPSLSGSVATPKTGAQQGTVIVAGTMAVPGTSAQPATTIGALTPSPELESPLIAASRVSAPHIDEAAETIAVGPPNMTLERDTVFDPPRSALPSPHRARPPTGKQLEERSTIPRMPTPRPAPRPIAAGSNPPVQTEVLDSDTDEEGIVNPATRVESSLRASVATPLESSLRGDPTIRDPRADPTKRDSRPRHAAIRDSRRAFDRRVTPTGNESTLDIRGKLPKRVMLFGVLVALGILSFAIVLLAVGKTKPAPADDPTGGAVEDPAGALADAPVDTIAVIPIDSAEHAPTPEASAPTRLEVHTDPDHATIKVGDQTGTAPAQFTLPAGHYTIVAELDGYRAEQREVDLPLGKHLEQDIALARKIGRPSTPMGKLTARTTPYAEVFLNGKKLGATPFADVDLAPGVYTLTFKNPGLPAVTKKVTITAGKTTKLAFSL
jgi:serine/threonine-protein kinase